ncbi:MAG: hypothetical protein AABY84_06015 [Candidatus Firestonebacteria bacterium]
MKTYEVVLTKSYIVKIKANNKRNAKEYSTFFTGDIQDISKTEDRQKLNFEIEDIDCKVNETFEVKEIYE